MRGWIVAGVIFGGLGVWLYIGMRQTYGPFGVVRRTQCWSHLKSIGRAALLYSDDHDGRLMLRARWMDTLTAPKKGGSLYLQGDELLHCPCIPHENPEGRFGYAYNSKLSGAKISSFELPEHMPLVFESKDWRRNVADPLLTFPGPFDPSIPESARANIVYLSGHVERSIRE